MNNDRIHIFKALANDTRLTVIDALRERPLNVGEICNATGFEQSRVSHSLRFLEKNCFVKKEKIGKEVFYELSRDTLLPIVIMADEHIKKHGKGLNRAQHTCGCEQCIDGKGEHTCGCAGCMEGGAAQHSCGCKKCMAD